MKGNAITLGAAAAKFAMLEVACCRCERRGRLRINRLIEQHGADIGLPALCDVLSNDCPKREAAAGERCNLYYPQLLRLWDCTGKSLDEL
jgi:hypothetical protein